MRWWHPEPDEPELLAWWRPLLDVARLAREDGFPWGVHVEDFRLVGRVLRSGRPDVWVYAHVHTRRELLVDDEGGTYRFSPTPKGPGVGRLLPSQLRRALWQAGVPHGPTSPLWTPWEPLEVPAPAEEPDEQVGRARGRSNLRLVR